MDPLPKIDVLFYFNPEFLRIFGASRQKPGMHGRATICEANRDQPGFPGLR
jgi:hypothetical protein